MDLKGVVLAGGTGSRLMPLTKVTNKHLLPIGQKPMIYYPIEKLTSIGIAQILIVTGVEYSRKVKRDFVQPWQPKDYEMRTIPFPEQAINLLTAWQSVAPESCPYVFMEQERWDYYCKEVSEGRWSPGQSLVNNILRRFKTICQGAGVGPYNIHDLRRSCITNWAKHLPIHVVQQLAGHSDIRTTQEYYLSVQEEDIRKARRVQTKLLGKIPAIDLTDPKVTHSARIRAFPGRAANRRNW